MIHEGKIYIGQIPCLKITTDEDLKGIVIFYHGWTSTKELQSLRGHILAAYGSTSSFQRPLTTGKEVSSITKKIPRRITILEYYFYKCL